MYETPKNVLQEKINETLSTGEESIISDLMKLCLLQKAEKDENLLCFTEMYNLLGLEKFTALVALVDGKTITFPASGTAPPISSAAVFPKGNAAII